MPSGTLRAPITNEEERVLFQRRLSLAARVVFGLAFMFWSVQLAAVAVLHREHIAEFLTSRMALETRTPSSVSSGLRLISTGNSLPSRRRP